MMFGRLARLIFLGALAAAAPRCAEAAARMEVPIGQVVLPDGAVRYWVPVTVGGSGPFQAMLDTGSFGLRVLERALPPASYQPTGIERTYMYGSGVLFHGMIARAVVGVGGGATGALVPIQVVRSVDCAPRQPDCPASRVSPSEYLIGGNGLAGQGFPAIIGLSMRSPGLALAADNPLSFFGTRRWIIMLPRSGLADSGRLILNPSSAEVARFKTFQLSRQGAGWRDGVVNGCLGRARGGRSCRSTRLDSGGDPGAVAPFLSYGVLYDQSRGRIGFMSRGGEGR